MLPEKIKTTICIVGAGPAGATASIFLCKMGIAHVIVDAANRAANSTLDDLGSAGFLADIAAMNHEILPNRLFRS